MMLIFFAVLGVMLLGYMAQQVGLCMVRGVSELLNGRPYFIMAILSSGAFVWISVLIAEQLNINYPFHDVQISPWVFVGGLIFGIGSAFNQGCSVSTIGRLACGQLKMLVTVIGWFTGWLIITYWIQSQYWSPTLVYLKVAKTTHWHTFVLMALSIGILAWTFSLTKEHRKIWFSMLTIGLVAGSLFLIEPRWTHSSFLQDLSYSLIHQDDQRWPANHRFLLAFSTVIGMVLAAWKNKYFGLRIPNFKTSMVHLFAGTLMGIGASLAGGGNDSLILLALPAFSLAGSVSLIGIILGIIMVKKLNLQRDK